MSESNNETTQLYLESNYDSDEFDKYGYNKYGYNTNFVHKDGYDLKGFDIYGHHIDDLEIFNIEFEDNGIVNKKINNYTLKKSIGSNIKHIYYISKIPHDSIKFKEDIEKHISKFEKYLKYPIIDKEKKEYSCHPYIGLILILLIKSDHIKSITEIWNLNVRYSVYKYLSYKKDRYKTNHYKDYKNKNPKQYTKYYESIKLCDAYMEEQETKDYKKSNFKKKHNIKNTLHNFITL